MASTVSEVVRAQPQTGSQSDVDAGSILRQEEALQREEPAPLREPEVEAPLPELTGIGEVTVTVESIEFKGATGLVEAAALEQAVGEAIGQTLDFEGLQALAERVTRRLKDEGWVLARAYLPEQDVTDGTIVIEIVPGKLDAQGRAFRIEAVGEQPLRIDTQRLGAMLTALLEPGEPVRQEDLDRAILLINDLPGIDALARLEPGESAGSTHILLSVREGPLWAASTNASNHGSRSTGAERAGVTANLNDPLGIGDQLSFSLTRSEGLGLAQANYARPLGAAGLRLNLGHTNLRYEVVNGDSAEFDVEGDAWTNTAGLTFPVLRKQSSNINIGFDWTYEALEDRVLGAKTDDKRVEYYSPQISGDHTDQLFGPTGRTNFSIAPVWGEVDLSRVPSSLESDIFGTQGYFEKVDWNISRLQSLGEMPITLFTELRGQLADDALDSSLGFQGGGPGGVRAYPGGEASGDEGYLLRTELRYQLPEDFTELGSLRLSAFYDSAWVTTHTLLPPGFEIDTATGENSYQIEGAGLGLTLTRGDWLTVSMNWAATIGDNPGRDAAGNNSDGRDDEQRAWLQAVIRL
ncbi:ShlB/FhaC/HecB family hemolysin secretion/activation protein [Spiribacter pallidus]|uniref:ShlB/FhaC/HecB family hemolysin secretion/activation protein n=1 Tax=Spiribacter pallidus TaxID=1987936 RepID=UPI00349F7592